MKGAGRYILMMAVIAVNTVALDAQEQQISRDYQYALIEAVKQKNLGNISEAVKLYRLVIRDKPDCDAAHYELGTIYMMSNKPELAKERLEEAYELDRENRWYILAYLNALGALEEYDTMIGILRERIRKDPEEVEWEFQLANVYSGKGKERRAIRMLERIEKERGFSEKITLLKASIYESRGKYELARLEIEKVMALFPEALQFRIVAAELCLKNGKDGEAARYYREILEIDSTNIFALTNLTDYYRKKEEYAKSFHYLGKSFRNELIDVRRKMAILSFYLSEDEIVRTYGNELERLLEVFLEEHPKEVEGRLLATDFYIERREYDKAYKQLEKYLENQQGTYQVYMQAILLANAASLNEELVHITDEALKQFPDSADIRFFRGIGLYEKEEFELLVKNFDGISFEDFTEKEYAVQSKMLLAEAFYRNGNFGRSDSIFEALIEDDPDNHIVLNNYSYYLAERGEKLELAKEWSYKAIVANPENATFLDTYAWILYKLGEMEEAEKYILKALEKGGNNDPEVNEHAGDIQAKLGSYEVARAYYRKAIILGGDKDELKSKIGMIEAKLDE